MPSSFSSNEAKTIPDFRHPEYAGGEVEILDSFRLFRLYQVSPNYLIIRLKFHKDWQLCVDYMDGWTIRMGKN